MKKYLCVPRYKAWQLHSGYVLVVVVLFWGKGENTLKSIVAGCCISGFLNSFALLMYLIPFEFHLQWKCQTMDSDRSVLASLAVCSILPLGVATFTQASWQPSISANTSSILLHNLLSLLQFIFMFHLAHFTFTELMPFRMPSAYKLTLEKNIIFEIPFKGSKLSTRQLKNSEVLEWKLTSFLFNDIRQGPKSNEGLKNCA